ncbi:NAD(P)-dependent oxidoreductase [Spirochaeta isovalerica]|uniref:D-3-phosphoglycerate dehydrogenase n=1 Tax=Spirochaeta isovalerica TaxID=150 RepID=A0A841RFE3_9SPIO|nr:D-3-phosphoglycerate dehydrogenase [Spirochaeta isovalerica]
MKIHVIEPLAIKDSAIKEIEKKFREKGHVIRFFLDRNTDPDEIIRRCDGADIVVIANLPFPAVCVESLPSLKLLAVAFTGVDHVDLDACEKKGIGVCNASGYSTINVAELTIGLIIDVMRNITTLDPVTRSGGTKEGFIGNDLAGKTVGIIGMGAIGQKVARILHAFDCSLMAVKRKNRPLENELSIRYVEMDELLRESDIVTLHCPLTESTRHLIGEDELKLMKSTAYLINTARGPVVDSVALTAALESGEIAGAGIDVFDRETPLNPDFPLLGLKNTVVTPHVAFATEEAFVRRAEIVVDNILSWIDGNPKNVIL